MSSTRLKPLLSVVVPVSNLAGQLSNLKSWLGEKSQIDLFQVIVVHDIQDKHTSIELNAICNSVDGVLLLEGYFGSPGKARNKGIELATSNWICFWDADDLPNVSAIRESLLKNSESYEVIIGRFEVRDFKTNSLITPIDIDEKDLTEEMLARSPGLWRYLFHISVVKQINFPSLRMGEDQVFLSSIDLFSQRIFLDKSLFYTYFINRPGQLTRFKPTLHDLVEAQILLARNYRAKQQKSGHEFLFILLARVFLTGLYKKNFRLTILSTIQLLATCRILGVRGTLRFMRSVRREIRYYFKTYMKKKRD